MGYLIYALITSVATIVGGLLPLQARFKRLDSRYLVGFAAGAMISIAFFEMMPEIMPANLAALGLGFFSIYIIEKFIMIHTCGEAECESHTIGGAALIGIAMESLVDGIAIAVGYRISPALGIGIAMAVLIHELPRGFATTVIMKNANYRLRTIFIALAIDAGFTPLGALSSGLFSEGLFKNIIAFAAGTFLYVGASDLLPEAHKRFNIKVVFSVILGVALVLILGLWTI
ncbi:MAG TPA: hypothetical protein ENH97_02205 [bacterium]|nr:hypothetical protein [bacterium]